MPLTQRVPSAAPLFQVPIGVGEEEVVTSTQEIIPGEGLGGSHATCNMSKKEEKIETCSGIKKEIQAGRGSSCLLSSHAG